MENNLREFLEYAEKNYHDVPVGRLISIIRIQDEALKSLKIHDKTEVAKAVVAVTNNKISSILKGGKI